MSDRDTEAAYWFARMRAPDADADKAEFDAWLADPENAAEYARAEDNWLLVGGVAPEHLAAHRAASAKPARSSAQWALAAALVLALSLGFAWIFLGNRSSEPIVAENATGEVVLEDGTRVALMDGAKIDPKFSPAERRVILTGGRARFTVAHDEARPFRVEAAGSETTALGTIFEIDLTGGEPLIHLVEGSVEIRATTKQRAPLRLRPGQRAAVTVDGPKLVEIAATSEPVALVSPIGATDNASLLIADNLPLGAVIDRANRVNPARIELADPASGTRLVSGKFEVADAGSLARKLGVALDLDVEERGSTYILKPKIKN
ncbi:FecR domain-containing protein [Sphingopyxis sp. DBS4]|uniref:FecR family protein n=1 Tax=Sphingopyxis sp. DBS4 TaxID=2968500 RepID=UPI00214CB740|nr:FecR domain-containing protein [Sphingopyxis sp. DBS4]